MTPSSTNGPSQDHPGTARELNSPPQDQTARSPEALEVGEVVSQLLSITALDLPYVRDINSTQDKVDAVAMIARCRIHMRQAADLLQRLAEERDKWKGVTNSYCERQEELHRRAQKAESRADRAEADLSALKGRVVEVLEPLARANANRERRDPRDWLWGEFYFEANARAFYRRASELHTELTPKEP